MTSSLCALDCELKEGKFACTLEIDLHASIQWLEVSQVSKLLIYTSWKSLASDAFSLQSQPTCLINFLQISQHTAKLVIVDS